MKKWKIWFSQENACIINVEASTEEVAMTKAIEKWKEQAFPLITHVEVEK